jgi:hypothetical protein
LTLAEAIYCATPEIASLQVALVAAGSRERWGRRRLSAPLTLAQEVIICRRARKSV